MNTTFQSSVDIATEPDVFRAREHARSVVHRAGLGEREETRLATIVSELSRNVLKYAGSGICEFELLHGAGRTRLRVTCRDSGPGIANVEAALTDGYSTGATLGIGLPGVKRLADTFHISTGEEGTIVEVELHALVAPEADNG